VLPSLNCAVALSCSLVLTGMDELAGCTETDVSVCADSPSEAIAQMASLRRTRTVYPFRSRNVPPRARDAKSANNLAVDSW
jgi:hypothetical protein